jgi:hypothetical protein
VKFGEILYTAEENRRVSEAHHEGDVMEHTPLYYKTWFKTDAVTVTFLTTKSDSIRLKPTLTLDHVL